MPCHTMRISLPVEPSQTKPDWPFLSWMEWVFALPAIARRLRERQRSRQQLLELDDHLLDDIGLTREQAEEIGTRPFWR